MSISKSRVKQKVPRKLTKTILPDPLDREEEQGLTDRGLSDGEIIQLRREKYLNLSQVRFFEWLRDHIDLYRADPVLIKHTPPREYVYRMKQEGVIVDIIVRD